MWKSKHLRFIIIFIFSINLISQININHIVNNSTSEDGLSTNLKISDYWNLTSTPILIDNNGGTPESRTWAQVNSTEEWCNGAGTWSNPYIIENITIDGQNSDSGIFILDSDVYFIIRNCTLYNSGTSLDAGIRLSDVKKGQLINNNCSANNGEGIYLENVENVTALGNLLNNNVARGIYLQTCNNNTLKENIANSNGVYGIEMRDSNNNSIINNTANDNDVTNFGGLYVQNCDYNNISLNNFSLNKCYGMNVISSNNNTIKSNTVNNNSWYDIYLVWSHYNNISSNVAKYSENYGIYLSDSTNNLISENTANNNFGAFGRGIRLYSSDNNNISNNYIEDNSYIGLHADSDSDGNIVYNNSFLDNTVNAQDDGNSNNWDNGSSGNWWHDYNWYDLDCDGIGDAPYNISGSAISQDRFPIGQLNHSTSISVLNYSTLEKYMDDVASQYWQEVFNLTVIYYLAGDTGALIKNANLSYSWVFGSGNIPQDPLKPDGYYTFEINTTDADTILYTIQITAEHVNYSTQNLNFKLDIERRPTMINGSSQLLHILKTLQPQFPYNFTFEYNDTRINSRIGSLDELSYYWYEFDDQGAPIGGSGGMGSLVPIANDLYVLDFDTETRDCGNYAIYITLNKDKYEQRNAFIDLNITGYPTNLTSSNYTIDVIWNENSTIRVFYNDTLNNLGLNSSQVLYSVIELPFIYGVLNEEAQDGWYNLTFNSTSFSQIGQFTLNINASKKYYTKPQINITININVIPTNLTSINYSIVVDISESFTIRVFFNDTYNNRGINNAIVNYLVVENSSIFGLFIEESADGWYNIALNAIIFSKTGIFTITITINNTFFVYQQINITIQITSESNGNGNGNGDTIPPSGISFFFFPIIIVITVSIFAIILNQVKKLERNHSFRT